MRMLDDATADAADDAPSNTNAALACDGGLCDTTNGSACGVASVGAAHGTPMGSLPLFSASLVLVALVVFWRKHGRALVVFAVIVMTSRGALADAPRAVDVVVKDAPPPRRWVSLAWNPIPAFALGKASFDVVIAPFVHHALVLSPFYASASTAPIYVTDSGGNVTQLPKQRFEGFGGEIGYRYYFAQGGLRGFFLGPSFMLGSFASTAQDSTKTQFLDFGVAIDAGYGALIADRVVVAAGLGVQYNFTDKPIPNQQFPANVYANSGFRPRLLLSIGWAF